MFSLIQNCPFNLCLVNPLWSGQIHQMQLTRKSDLIINLMALYGNCKNAVRTRGYLIQRSGTDLSDEIPHHQQIQAFLLVHDVYYVYVF